MRKYLGPLIFGLAGGAILISLGIWQLQRLAWKTEVLGQIEARIAADPLPLPEVPKAEADKFMPVVVSGDFDGTDIPVFLSHEGGPVYRLVAVFETDNGRRIMVDRGGVPARGDPDEAMRTAPMAAVQVIGNLHWPDEVDDWTPDPDARGVFFGREVAQLAEALDAEPVLIVAREVSANVPPATLMPVTSTGIPNNHLGYAIQWFGLAIVWLGMTLFLCWRIRKRTV